MKNVRKNLALLMSMLLLCMAFSAIGVMAEDTELIYNGSLDVEDWYYTQGPDGWSLNKEADVWSKTVEEHGEYLENGGTQKTAYIYHQTGGINNSPYVEIDAVTYDAGDGDPKIKTPWIENLEGNAWYKLTFYVKWYDVKIEPPKIAMTFASENGQTVGTVYTGSNAYFSRIIGAVHETGWLKHEIRFKTPSWVSKVQMSFSAVMRKNASKVRVGYDEISFKKDETCVEYMQVPEASLGGDGASAWPTLSDIQIKQDSSWEYIPAAGLARRRPVTERPENGLMRAAFYYNAGESTENVTCISAVYKKTAEGTTLVNCYIDEMVRAAEINRLEQEITLPEASEGEEYTVKSYIWNSMTGLEPFGASNSFTY